MITYGKDEIISSSRIAKNFGSVLSELKNGTKKRAIISKNNELEAVIIPIEEYENIKESFELLEHLDIYEIVQERINSKPEVSWKEIKKENKIK
jgi:PHD/YefM family antitoxin component YafN of YafNO toxin-antitoxin module